MNEILSPYPSQFRGSKIVVLFEPRPYSDHFEQVMLTPQVALELHLFLKSRLSLGDNGLGFVVSTNKRYSADFKDIPEAYEVKL